MPNFKGFITVDKYEQKEWDAENNIFIENLTEEQRGNLIELEAKEINDESDFKTANEIPALRHIQMQATFQKYVDLGCSKTINMSANATAPISRVPVRNRTASNSASRNASAPTRSKRSRGRSSSGISRTADGYNGSVIILVLPSIFTSVAQSYAGNEAHATRLLKGKFENAGAELLNGGRLRGDSVKRLYLAVLKPGTKRSTPKRAKNGLYAWLVLFERVVELKRWRI